MDPTNDDEVAYVYDSDPKTPAAKGTRFSTGGSISSAPTTSGTPPPPPPSMDSIGGVTFKPKTGLVIDTVKTKVICTRTLREDWRTNKPEQYLDLQKDATGSTSDFESLDIPELKHAKTTGEVHDTVEYNQVIMSHLVRYGLDWFYTNIVFPHKDAYGNLTHRRQAGKTADLFKQCSTLTLGEVVDSVLYTYGLMHRSGTDTSPGENLWMADDLNWSGQYIKNQCSKELFGSIKDDLRNAKVKEDYWEYGPILYKALMDRISSSNSYSARNVSNAVDKADLFSGAFNSDIPKFCKEMRSSFKVLRSLEKRDFMGELIGESYVPQGMSKKLLVQFSKAGNEEFNDHFNDVLKAGNTRMRIHGVAESKAYPTPEDILDEALRYYKALDSNEEWEGPKQSALTVQAKHVKPGSKCFGCGRANCRQSDSKCPRHNQEANAAGAQARAEFDKAKADKKRANKAEKKAAEKAAPPKEPAKPTATKFQWPPPPQGNDPHELEINGKWHFWHRNHRKWYKKNKKSEPESSPASSPESNGNPSANLAQAGGAGDQLGAFLTTEMSSITHLFDGSEDAKLQERIFKNAIKKAAEQVAATLKK